MAIQNTMNKRGLVFSMGKVGSSTVMQAFREVGLIPERGHYWNINELKSYGLDNYKIVVVPFRDPIAHNISRYFESYGNEYLDGTTSIESAKECCADDWYPFCWFDQIFNPLFGIDVYQYEFNKNLGWSIIKERYLLIQTERLSEGLPDAFEKFFGIRPSSQHRAKTIDTRPYGELYKEFIQSVKFPKHQVSVMYNNQFVEHFFTKKQVDTWRERWTK